MSTRAARPQGPAPTEPQLREAALQHLARYAATEAGLVRVLDRRIERWLRAGLRDAATAAAAAESRQAARRVAARLVREGIVNDALYAQGRTRALLRAGRSGRMVAANLAQRGIGPALVRHVLPDNPNHELAAALLLLRKRRLGPYGKEAAAAPEDRRRILGILARAGFSHETATAALRQDMESADERIEGMRRG